MKRDRDDFLRRVLEIIEKYEALRWGFSRIVALKILGFLSFLEKQSKKGLILRRIRYRLRDKYQTGTEVPGREFREFEGVESAFIGAFHYRLYPYSKIIILILAIVMIDYASTCSITVDNAGFYASVFTFIGTLVFARGLFRGARGLFRGASQFDHTNNYGTLRKIPNEVEWNKLVFLAYSSADAVWAAIFVAIGFLLNVMTIFPISSPLPC